VSDEVEVKVNPAQIGSAEMSRTVNHGDVYSADHKFLYDADRRKRLVIASGIAEDSQIDDKTAFTAICEQHLRIKPATAGGVRLGKRRKDAARRLLVRLYREKTVVELLKSIRPYGMLMTRWCVRTFT